MKLSEKIYNLRKKNGLSQEELAEKLNVSRQAVSRWEVGSALPDASNILQLSELFEVSADYLLKEEYESDRDIPAVKRTEARAEQNMKSWLAASVSMLGLGCNFVIYVLSRFVEVMVPRVRIENGVKIYSWNYNWREHSYIYFVKEYDLELLCVAFWLIFAAGIGYLLWNSRWIQNKVAKHREKQAKLKNQEENQESE